MTSTTILSKHYKIMNSYQELCNTIMAQPLIDEEERYDYHTEYAFSVLHAAYPQVSAVFIADAVDCDWDEQLTDEENINNCKYLEEYV